MGGAANVTCHHLFYFDTVGTGASINREPRTPPTHKYVGEPSFVINVKSSKTEFIEEMKNFREDPEYLIYDKQNIDDEDLETLRTLYRRGTPVTKEELDEVFGEETDYKILA